ncbi:MAG TPA: SUMF1/EgtB/PvdO family nonheme iron enzyme [Chitinophagales bacterium]|nr:SUMF1/EgtB/PvdO family nonheme iron enzyme [Chitinophagales bacterium]
MEKGNEVSFAVTVITTLTLLTVSCLPHKNDDFAKIPGGEYLVGAEGHSINPKRVVTISTFFISKTEVTNKQFDDFVTATHYRTDAEKFHNAEIFYPGLDEFQWAEDSNAFWRFPNGTKYGGIENKMNHPVTCISFNDALAYCRWAGVRLPTLDEWEIASRGNKDTKYFWGNEDSIIYQYANVWKGENHKKAGANEDYTYTAPVKSFPPNEFGLFDIYGNVFEFCSDKPGAFEKEANLAFARGGSWWCSDNACGFFNSVDIGRVIKNASFSNQGFRVVKVSRE